jgi:hypothetical protein
MGEACNMHRRDEISVRKCEGKTPLGRPKHRWEDNIKTDLKEIGCEYVDWIHAVENGIQ